MAVSTQGNATITTNGSIQQTYVVTLIEMSRSFAALSESAFLNQS